MILITITKHCHIYSLARLILFFLLFDLLYTQMSQDVAMYLCCEHVAIPVMMCSQTSSLFMSRSKSQRETSLLTLNQFYQSAGSEFEAVHRKS